MTDLHTHILPGIDDGSRTVDESISLLKAELESGVHTVALTPHFRSNTMAQSEFLKQRESAYEQLLEAVRQNGLRISFVLGAEVEFSPELLRLDLDSLCYEDTKTLLVELPMFHYNPFTCDVFYKLLLKG